MKASWRLFTGRMRESVQQCRKECGLPGILASVGIAVFVTGGVLYAQQHLMVVYTKSIPHRLVWRTGEVAEVGSYGSFVIEHPLSPGEWIRVTKYVACGEGTEIEAAEGGVRCDGRLVARAKPRTKTGVELEAFEYDGQIPEGKLFVIGNGDWVNSIDSRYFGFLDMRGSERVVPVF